MCNICNKCQKTSNLFVQVLETGRKEIISYTFLASFAGVQINVVFTDNVNCIYLGMSKVQNNCQILHKKIKFRQQTDLKFAIFY